MKIVREDNGTQCAQISVTFGEEDYQEQVKKALNDHRRKASIPGFRPGKVPFGMVKKMYGKGVLVEEVNKLLSTKIDAYLKEEKMNILGYPIPTEDSPFIDFDNNTAFEFKVEVGLAPTADLSFIDEATFPYYKIKLDQKRTDEHLAHICKQFGDVVDAESFAKEDKVEGTFEEVDENGELIVDGISYEATPVFNEEESVTEKFDGLKVNDTLTFVAEELFDGDTAKANQFLAYQGEQTEKELEKLNFRFTIKAIKHTNPAELNEELFKKVYPQKTFENKEEFVAHEVEMLEKQMEAQTDMYFLNKTSDQIVESVTLELPEAFLKRWINHQRQSEAKEGDTPAPLTEEELKNTLTGVRWEILQEELMKKYEVKIEEEDVKRVAKIAIMRQYMPNFSADKIDEMDFLNEMIEPMMKNQEQYRQYFNMAANEALTVKLKEGVNLEINEVSIEEFEAIVYPPTTEEEVKEEEKA